MRRPSGGTGELTRPNEEDSAALGLLLLLAAPAGAQEWPTRPVTMIVPYAAGGPVDTLGRILGAGLSDVLGQQITIENVGGAGGMTGSNRVAKAAPDGYTMLMAGTSVMAQNQTLYKHPLYDAATDFAPAALVTDSARVLITRKDFPADNFEDFVAYAKTHQDSMKYGTAGVGSGAHICAILLDQAMGTKITHVPYRGSAPAMQDMIGGRIDALRRADLDCAAADPGQRRQGDCDDGAERAPGLEDLPTAAELGYPTVWIAVPGALLFSRRARRSRSCSAWRRQQVTLSISRRSASGWPRSG